jgi:hypothetical protein
MRELWFAAGLVGVDTREITVQRTFSDFDDYWATIFGGPSVGPSLAAMAADDLQLLEVRMRGLVAPDAAGRIMYSARRMPSRVACGDSPRGDGTDCCRRICGTIRREINRSTP